MPQEYTASDRVISVRVGDDFVVVLAANPTTGYQWEPHFGAALIQLIERVLAASGSGIGSGGTERFRFRALGPGDGELRMTYRRPWETAPAQELVFELHIGA
jgi:inhibitor of cysteine peptidase